MIIQCNISLIVYGICRKFDFECSLIVYGICREI